MNNQQNPTQEQNQGFNQSQQQQNQGFNPNPQQQFSGNPYVPFDVNDHTREFSQKDISDNKVWALLPYLTGILGILVAKICAPNSGFVDFHARQAMKFFVLNWAIALVSLILCFTFIIPILGGILLCVLGVVQIISLVKACCGKAWDPVIIRSVGFLK